MIALKRPVGPPPQIRASVVLALVALLSILFETEKDRLFFVRNDDENGKHTAVNSVRIRHEYAVTRQTKVGRFIVQNGAFIFFKR